MSAESFSQAEPELSTRKSAQWICEALADLVQAVSEPVDVNGLGTLTNEVMRIGNELAKLNRTLESIATLIANEQGGEEQGR